MSTQAQATNRRTASRGWRPSRRGLCVACAFVAILVFVWLSARPSLAQQQTVGPNPQPVPIFDECGTVIEPGVCRLFMADDGNNYVVAGLNSVNVGDRVRVIGSTDMICATMCTTPVSGCILNPTLTFCATGTPVCFGDGGDQMGCTDCPCGNNAPQDAAGGCVNSSGTSARLVASGNPGTLVDTLRMEVEGMNPNTFGVLVSAGILLPQNPVVPCPTGSGVQSVLLDGLRCVGGALFRHAARGSDANGDVGETTPGWGPPNGPPQGLVAQGGFVMGQTVHFQVFYREFGDLVCQTGQNTTNAITVVVGL